ncbi:MAG: 2-C-methyl-D-erythritol 4-phosphate cytidylyltransferase [Treponema sp.]|nr:2-C-methyl-D-erythritol 4-phosphate cytidylyltransferase [Treponema sp.]
MIIGGIAVIILAAGSSSRMSGIKKEFYKLETGISVLGTSTLTFASVPQIDTVVIVVQEGNESAAREALPPALLANPRLKIKFVTGGTSRRASVFNALSSLENSSHDYILIHDGARPWVSSSLVEAIIEAVIKHNAVIPLLPITDTPKEYDGQFVKNHLKRACVGTAQTPQAFKFTQILEAHKKAAEVSEDFTDDAEIWGRFIGQVACIPGEPENKKITFNEDLH